MNMMLGGPKSRREITSPIENGILTHELLQAPMLPNTLLPLIHAY
jgi:hypothetical protein